MKTLNKILIVMGIFLIAFASCKKDEEQAVVYKNITGKVTMSGSAVSGAAVSLSGTLTGSAVTDGSGNYTINNLTEGDYKVKAAYTDSRGFNFASGESTVKIGNQEGAVTVDLTVQ